jgi:hypothetical protein
MSVHHWRNGEPTPAGIETFTEGDCWILAVELGRIASLPVYQVNPSATSGWAVHWVVKLDGDRYLDVEGIHGRSALLRRWEAVRLRMAASVALECAELDREAGASAFEDSWRRAPIMARRLLDKYVPDWKDNR